MSLISILFVFILVYLFIPVIYRFLNEWAVGYEGAKRGLVIRLMGVSLAVMLVCVMDYINNKITFEARQAAIKIVNSEQADISKEDEWAVLKEKYLMNKPISLEDAILLRIAESKIRKKHLEDEAVSNEDSKNPTPKKLIMGQ